MWKADRKKEVNEEFCGTDNSRASEPACTRVCLCVCVLEGMVGGGGRSKGDAERVQEHGYGKFLLQPREEEEKIIYAERHFIVMMGVWFIYDIFIYNLYIYAAYTLLVFVCACSTKY